MTREQILKLKSKDDIDLEIPTKLELYPYQKVGAAFMYSVKKCFNLDHTGKGKTVQALGYLKLIEKFEKKRVKALIVVISATLHQWKGEIEKFTDLKPIIVDGSKNARRAIYEHFNNTDDYQVLLMNYTKINHDFDDINRIKFDTIIFDEATSLKDNTSQQYQYYNWLTMRVDRIVMMTATPITSSLLDFYNMFQLFHIKDYLPPYEEFRDTYLETKPVKVKRGRKTFVIQNVVGSKLNMIEPFRQLMDPFYIQRNSDGENKLHIHKLPAIMTETQKRLCQDLKIDIQMQLKEGEDINNLKLYGDFQKIACSPYIYNQDEPKEAPKVDVLLRFLEEDKSKDKVIIFAKYLEFHEIVRYYLDQAGIKYVSITGVESDKQKEKNRQAFWDDPSIRVILLTGAGKFGLNLHVAHKFILLDIPYTPADAFQYFGRIDRSGQEHKDLDIYFIFMVNTMEEDLFFRLERRQEESDAFSGTDKSKIFSLGEKYDCVKGFLSKNYSSREDEKIEIETISI